MAGSGATYNYLGSSFTNFERYLLTTGTGDDYIDSRTVAMDDWLTLGTGNNTALTNPLPAGAKSKTDAPQGLGLFSDSTGVFSG